MNAQVNAVNLRIVEFNEGLVERLINKQTNILDACKELQSLKSEKWWAEQSEKFENAKTAMIDAASRAGDWTKAKIDALGQWFDEMGQKMSEAWANFKETVGEKWENFKGAMSEFGNKIAEMWGNAMDSLGKLWDEIKIGAHDMAVDLKTGVLNLCTDMQCGVANLGIGMQKAGLAMDDAYQQVKGTISGAIGDKFNQSAGQLCTESTIVVEGVIKNKTAELEKFKKDYNITVGEDGKNIFPTEVVGGLNPKTIKSSFEHQESVIADLKGQQQELTSKMKSREGISAYMDEVTKGTKDKKDANVETRGALNNEVTANKNARDTEKGTRNTEATKEKQSYADKVREERTASKNNVIQK